MYWPGGEGGYSELPPAKGAGRGTALSMVSSSLVNTVRPPVDAGEMVMPVAKGLGLTLLIGDRRDTV